MLTLPCSTPDMKTVARAGKSKITKAVVPKKGLEPPHPCGYMDLNHARLPIPPLRPVTWCGGLAPPNRKERQPLFYRAASGCQTRAIKALAGNQSEKSR